LTSSRTTWRGKPAALVMVRDISERKRAERALKESEENFRAIAENANDGMVIMNAAGICLFANRRMTEMTGRGAEELIGLHLRQLAPPDIYDEAEERLTKRLKGETIPNQHEAAMLRKDGTRFPIELTSATTTWRGIPADLVILRDTTERKEAEEELRRSEARYRAVVEDQQELITRWNAELELTFVNDALCRYFGKTREELLGKAFIPLIPQEDHERVETYFAGLGPKSPVTSIEHRVITPSGEIRWQEWTNRLLFDEQGKVAEGQSVGRDITERKWAEEALRQSEKHIREVFEAATNVSFIRTDADGLDTIITEFSKGAESIFGYSREEIIGEPLGILYTPGSLTGFPTVLETVQRTGRPFSRRLTLVRKNGEEFEAFSTCCPIFDGKGELVGTLGVAIETKEEMLDEEPEHREGAREDGTKEGG
jgi:PAS domain S-box-containing protein